LYALISQKALAGRAVHESPAFLAAHAVGGSFRHCDFVFSSAGTFVRSGQPFHEFGHERNITPQTIPSWAVPLGTEFAVKPALRIGASQRIGLSAIDAAQVFGRPFPSRA
jgi:hypothetical protein